MSEIQEKDWEYTEECVNVFNYDIVTPAWAKECSSWCERHFGSFIWNEECAFGLIGSKPMNVLRACQKASFSEHFALSSDASKLLCILIAVLGCCSGIAFHVFFPEQLVPKFDTAEEEGKLKLAPFIAIPGCVTRKFETCFDICKMAVTFMLDTFSRFFICTDVFLAWADLLRLLHALCSDTRQFRGSLRHKHFAIFVGR